MSLKSIVLNGLYKLPPRVFWTVMAAYRPPVHFGDDLAMWNRSLPFEQDQKFLSSYKSAMSFATTQVQSMDVRWRAYTACWAAATAAKLPGDFVECGVNTGLLSGTICRYLDFHTSDRQFWLFDTYEGIPADMASLSERKSIDQYNQQYPDVWEVAQANFADFSNANLIRGLVPDTLPSADIRAVSYLSIDMNIAAPEKAALDYFWPKMTSGGIILLDDYGFLPHEEQRSEANAFAMQMGVKVLPLATGQGIIIKP